MSDMSLLEQARMRASQARTHAYENMYGGKNELATRVKAAIARAQASMKAKQSGGGYHDDDYSNNDLKYRVDRAINAARAALQAQQAHQDGGYYYENDYDDDYENNDYAAHPNDLPLEYIADQLGLEANDESNESNEYMSGGGCGFEMDGGAFELKRKAELDTKLKGTIKYKDEAEPRQRKHIKFTTRQRYPKENGKFGYHVEHREEPVQEAAQRWLDSARRGQRNPYQSYMNRRRHYIALWEELNERGEAPGAPVLLTTGTRQSCKGARGATKFCPSRFTGTPLAAARKAIMRLSRRHREYNTRRFPKLAGPGGLYKVQETSQHVPYGHPVRVTMIEVTKGLSRLTESRTHLTLTQGTRRYQYHYMGQTQHLSPAEQEEKTYTKTVNGAPMHIRPQFEVKLCPIPNVDAPEGRTLDACQARTQRRGEKIKAAKAKKQAERMRR